MTKFVAKRIRLRNGEHHSVLSRPLGLPVHEVTLYLDKYRKRGRAANTIHAVCSALALLYTALDRAKVDLLQRVKAGHFLTVPELNRVADAAQRRVADDPEEAELQSSGAKVVDIRRARMRLKPSVKEVETVDVATQASRLRYIADYLEFLVSYFGSTLSAPLRRELEADSAAALKAFRGQIPPVSKRAKLGAREGLSREDQDRILNVVHPDSPDNPWARGFVRKRNWLIVVLLLATGMRRGELLGLQLKDLDQRLPKMRILRRADAKEDVRRLQPNTKTNDRELELRPALMRAVWAYIRNHRNKIKAARKFPQLIVADDGKPLSLKAIDKIFAQLREACPGLPGRLTSHVLRHTWNERFSEQAELLGLTDAVEEKARNEQQGWSDNSQSASNYTRRHATKKGREISLKLQEQLNAPEN